MNLYRRFKHAVIRELAGIYRNDKRARDAIAALDDPTLREKMAELRRLQTVDRLKTTLDALDDPAIREKLQKMRQADPSMRQETL